MAETCAGCKHTVCKWKFLGWRWYCLRFHCLRTLRCIDYRGKK